MDDQDVYFVDDERNAIVARPSAWGRPPAMMRPRPAPRPWPVPVQAARPYYYPPAPQRPPVVIVQRPPSLFAGIDLGEVVERGVNLVAAWQSLPSAPTVSGDPSKDVGNMILYQEALADHAKTDERVRAFGGLAAQVVKVVAKNVAQQRAAFGPMNFGGFGIGG